MGMVDISEKKEVLRIARARGTIVLKSTTVDVIKKGEVKKGDVFETAKVAGMLAVKNTPSIIPHCHPIPVESVEFKFNMHGNRIDVECEVKAHYKTGVEMEALTGVSVALLTIWDMVKYLEKDEHGQYPMTQILGIEVVEKRKGE
ncbi:molybdenum cofactor biosynthesis protein MoaC [Aciduliprofundum sp. MAR08-339]|uniref:cyclic pyranopterin monophosphate synthase MoaC n=1 Tax=Aciduliprofundum sp. (strain MAR08-339) TaxID=673860 RepID=UPI0002A4C38C|nr:molybdenum cofactor biosynthesis protein MoaC [Aciduliprofundum sp. MAR08-339]